MADYKKFKRVFGLVMDSIGTGEAPDADKFDDEGSDTLGSIGKAFEGKLELPTFQKLGLSNLRDEAILGVPKVEKTIGYYAKAKEVAIGKDSIDGHWEMMGLHMPKLDYFPDGFPEDLLKKVEDYSGRKIIGNIAISGTEILKQLGERQMETGELIVYTSGDSVFQIAAHEEIIPLEELYDICRYTRSLLNGPEYKMGRVIARPYVGTKASNFKRTSNRHDFGMEPYDDSAIDKLQQAGYDTIAIGKTADLFSMHGFNESYHNDSNMDGMDHMDEVMTKDFTGFCFANLVDFDAMYGHRRDAMGDGKALMDLDRRLATVVNNMHDDDLLIITADHGNDPLFKGTDHTREYVPLLVYSPSFKTPGSLGIRETFADFGDTVLDNFNLDPMPLGESFLSELN